MFEVAIALALVAAGYGFRGLIGRELKKIVPEVTAEFNKLLAEAKAEIAKLVAEAKSKV